jgi:hypothetical protein
LSFGTEIAEIVDLLLKTFHDVRNWSNRWIRKSGLGRTTHCEKKESAGQNAERDDEEEKPHGANQHRGRFPPPTGLSAPS